MAVMVGLVFFIVFPKTISPSISGTFIIVVAPAVIKPQSKRNCFVESAGSYNVVVSGNLIVVPVKVCAFADNVATVAEPLGKVIARFVPVVKPLNTKDNFFVLSALSQKLHVEDIINLFPNVSVVVRPKIVLVPVGNVWVPEFDISAIMGLVIVLFKRVSVSATPLNVQVVDGNEIVPVFEIELTTGFIKVLL